MRVTVRTNHLTFSTLSRDVFLQYQPGLPNFETTYEKDPFGLKFKSQPLSTVHGYQLPKDDKQKNTTERFITHKHRECTWDSKLILTKAPWPVRSASYTRHRRQRDAYSAFMDRVEEKFTKICKSSSGIWGRERCLLFLSFCTCLNHTPLLLGLPFISKVLVSRGEMEETGAKSSDS
ncbi:uncharacterized protein C6H7orf78 isoform X2 [Pongo pygmaeus]|uniref:uncharacterized protein C6H7orf78 isoform X2 n=1 Tax=Pongo pygmaeus TaxID=9600 RepID=UPI0001D5EF80|nr:uncharacterized protein LOC129040885 isoform X2 [Pongo pygmaeus]